MIQFDKDTYWEFLEVEIDEIPGALGYCIREDRQWIDPLKIEEYILSLPVQRWAPELREAYDTITHYMRDAKGDTLRVLEDCLLGLMNLVHKYKPELAGELKTRVPMREPCYPDKKISPSTEKTASLPPGIPNCEKSRLYLNRLVEERYLDQEYKPTEKLKFQVKRAYVISKLRENIDIDVDELAAWWGVNNVTQTMSNAKNSKKKYRDIDALFDTGA